MSQNNYWISVTRAWGVKMPLLEEAGLVVHQHPILEHQYKPCGFQFSSLLMRLGRE